MGAGAVLIPGGNDALLLHGILNLSLHAFLAYVTMVLGIAAYLLAGRLAGREITRIDCGGDVCRSD